LLQGDNIVGAAEDYETLCQVISLIKEEIIEGSEDIDNKKIVEKLVVYYCE
jgi:anti-sigma28 factor (negative regulator of flagellin synthesis)